MPKPDEYQVEGYNVRTEGYDAPYHPSADFNPSEDFAYAGAPKKQAEHQKELAKRKRPSQFKSPREREKRDAELRVTNVDADLDKTEAPKKKASKKSTAKKTAKKAAKKVTPAKKS